jgi:ABC-type nickel/cobalt efflux system permease component RcnA
MLSPEIILLCSTAATIGFVHTALGPDHYLPFVMMARVRKWTLNKTVWVTVLSGLGHVLSSVVLGIIGIFVGAELMKLELFESLRGSLAAWILIGFGFAYFVWGVFQAIKNKKHSHIHVHEGGVIHDHPHSHIGLHAHVHDHKQTSTLRAPYAQHQHHHTHSVRDITPWILFTIFVLGPCEPLIPLLMYPAAKSSMAGMYLVATIFSLTTIITMVGIVLLGIWGIGFVKLGKLERYTHAIAGATICLSGLAIMFLGL